MHRERSDRMLAKVDTQHVVRRHGRALGSSVATARVTTQKIQTKKCANLGRVDRKDVSETRFQPTNTKQKNCKKRKEKNETKGRGNISV